MEVLCKFGCGREVYAGLPYCRTCIETRPIPALAGIDSRENHQSGEIVDPPPDNVRKLHVLDGGKSAPPSTEPFTTPAQVLALFGAELAKGNIQSIAIVARMGDGNVGFAWSTTDKNLLLVMADILLAHVRKRAFGI